MTQTIPSIQDMLDGPVVGMRLCVVSHGCKVNKVESDTVAANLLARGAKLVDLPDATLVIVNTCTVTGEADKKARKAVRHALRLAPRAAVVVTGCSAAMDPQGYAAIDERVRVVARHKLIEACTDGAQAPLRIGSQFRTRVNLKIQDGCDHACTYCIVHVARGPAHSTPFEEVAGQARAYLEQGVSELVLTGIDLGSYASDGKKLEDLCAHVLCSSERFEPGHPRPARIRASSLEPMTIRPRFVELIADGRGRLCRHLHVPVQSGSSRVLREMARPYDAEEYRALVEGLYAQVPELSLSTDIIVGFPGETEQDFQDSLDLARECRFSKIHVFPYSRRSGTPAAARDDQVPPEVINRRAAQMRELSEKLRAADLAARAGTKELALVETGCALTESYHEIGIPAGAAEGALVEVCMGEVR